MPEPNKNLKESLHEIYNKKFVNLNVSEKKDPVLFKIKTSISSDEVSGKQDEISILCFEYLLDNKSMAYDKSKRGIYDSILNVLSVIDNRLAEYVGDLVNKDKVMASRINEKGSSGVEPLSIVLFDENNTKGPIASENTATSNESDEDPRIENLKELLKRFKSKEVDPWHHKNSEKFDDMVKSIEHAVEYSNAMKKGCGSKEVLEKMLKDVRNTTLDYIEKKSDTPDSKYGQSRINLAIASLLSVDRKKGLEAIDWVATKRMIRLHQNRDEFLLKMGEDPSKTRFSKSTFMSLDKIIEETGYKDSPSREDIDQALKDRMQEVNDNLFDQEFGTNELKLASYVLLKAMTDMFKQMTGLEWKQFDISEEELQNQRANIMVSQPFIMTREKMFGDDPLNSVQPEEFYVTFKITIVEIRKANMDNPTAAKVNPSRVNTAQPKTRNNDGETRNNTGETKRNASIPRAKSPEEQFDDMKKFFKLDDSATYDEVRKAVRKDFIKHHPDKHSGASPEELEKHVEIFRKLSDWNQTLTDHKARLQEIEHKPEMSVPTNEAPARGMSR